MKHIPAAQPQTLVGFLRSIGGLRDCGELRALDARKRWPGLVNDKRGRTLDHARESAAEAGFLGEPIDDAMTQTTVSDFLDALESHPHYRVRDGQRLGDWQAQALGNVFEDAIHNEICALEAWAADHDGPDYRDKALFRLAAKLSLESPFIDYGDALERAAIQLVGREEDEAAEARAAECPPEPLATSPAPLAPDPLPPQPKHRRKASTPVHIAAQAWRKAHGWTRGQLSTMTGYSLTAINDFEHGSRRGKIGKYAQIDGNAWLRYRLACKGLDSAGSPPF